MTTLFMTATAVAGIISGPVSGWILSSFSGYQGMAGWQWMFLLEGLPAVAVGIWIFLRLPSKPCEVKWLDDQERGLLEMDFANFSAQQRL